VPVEPLRPALGVGTRQGDQRPKMFGLDAALDQQ
jgi:hypothetical protein